MIYAITKLSSTVSVADPNLEVSVWSEKIRGAPLDLTHLL